MNDTTISIRISSKLLNEYKEFCDKKSIVLSKRIRKYMEMDLENWKRKERSKTKG